MSRSTSWVRASSALLAGTLLASAVGYGGGCAPSRSRSVRSTAERSSNAGADAPDPDDARESLADAERSFAGMSREKGMRASFLANLAEGAIVFRPRPVDGRKWYSERPESKGSLFWEPSYVEAARLDDLGFTSGPWEYREDAGQTDPSAYGHFVSVWKKQDDGEWKVVLDDGISHPAPVPGSVNALLGDERSLTGPKSAASLSDAGSAGEEGRLLEFDRAFSEDSRKTGAEAAYASRVSEDFRLYRSDVYPVVGRETALAALREKSGALSWTPAIARLSLAGDLGYTYGSFELSAGAAGGARADTVPGPGTGRGAGSGTGEQGRYLRLWRRNPEGFWSLVLDLMIPDPPPSNGSTN